KDNLIKNHDKMNPYPGMKQVLKSLSKKHRLFIITSNNSEVVEDFLRSRKMNYFLGIYGFESGLSKTRKIMFIKKKYRGFKHYYIGDTTGDIIEGRRAGVETIAVTWGWHPTDRILSSKPDHLVHTPIGLLKLFLSYKKISHQ
ncbi:MAG TPA: HAD family hydrolase, partial [Thermoplasmatales archaeon]|nr:HAD family hydrolase [Thermoplasmatales archaeon]